MNPDVGLIYNATDLSTGPQTVPSLGNGNAYGHAPNDVVDAYGAGPSSGMTFSVAPGAEHSAHKLQQQLFSQQVREEEINSVISLFIFLVILLMYPMFVCCRVWKIRKRSSWITKPIFRLCLQTNVPRPRRINKPLEDGRIAAVHTCLSSRLLSRKYEIFIKSFLCTLTVWYNLIFLWLFIFRSFIFRLRNVDI